MNRLNENDINVIALVKGDERYFFLYDDASRSECLRTLGRFASNQELGFTWYDAAVLSKKVRENATAQQLDMARIHNRIMYPDTDIDECQGM